MTLFGDDAVTYMKIQTSEDRHILQNDLQLLEARTFRWQMRLAHQESATFYV